MNINIFQLAIFSTLLIFSPDINAQSTRVLGVVKGLSKNGVQYIPASTKAPKNIKMGDSFFNHDQFITSDEGRVLLEFAEGDSKGNGNRVVLGANSDLVINAPESNSPGTSLTLNKGSVFSNVKKRYSRRGDNEFRVVTDNGVAGVRGTKFFVSYSNYKMGVAVLETHNNAGVEVRKDLYDFKDVKIVVDRQALVVNHGEQIADLAVLKINELPKDISVNLKATGDFEGSARSAPQAPSKVIPVNKEPEIKNPLKDGNVKSEIENEKGPATAGIVFDGSEKNEIPANAINFSPKSDSGFNRLENKLTPSPDRKFNFGSFVGLTASPQADAETETYSKGTEQRLELVDMAKTQYEPVDGQIAPNMTYEPMIFDSRTVGVYEKVSATEPTVLPPRIDTQIQDMKFLRPPPLLPPPIEREPLKLPPPTPSVNCPYPPCY